jgi:SAM-dependent methyltransferase
LTVAAAVTGSKYAYLPYPQYSAPARSNQSERPLGADGNLVLLSRYAAGIKSERWARRELFGLALSTQQLAENLRQAQVEIQEQRGQAESARISLGEARAAGQEAERQCAGARQELAAVYRSKSWRWTALLRVFYKAAAMLRPRSPVQHNSATALPMAPQPTSQRPAGTMQVSELFPSLEREIGPWRKLLKGRVLNAGAGNRDLSPMVEGELTNQDIPQGLHNANIHIYSPLHRIPREDGYFDTVFCNAVLEHVINPEEIVAEFSRVCRPGGHLYLSVPFLQPEHKDPTDYQRYTADGLAALVSRHGFRSLAVEPVHNIYTTLGWITVAWLSFSDCRRNLLLRRLLYPLLRHLSIYSKEQVPAAASAYRVIAVRHERLGAE